jgi:hypothetical protein
MKEIVLEFEGYWTEAAEKFIPSQSGIYCVYRAKHDPINRKVQLKELLYIGESENVRQRINTHEKKPLWKEHLKNGETLCYSFTPILYDRNRAEAALIHQHKPVENWEYTYDFPFQDTVVFLTGKTLCLSTCFAVFETLDSEAQPGWSRSNYKIDWAS